MVYTCGIFLISSDNLILIGHPTGSKDGKWSIPKGELDPGEKPIECAVREFKEEANILLAKYTLNQLYDVKYAHGKKTLIPFYFKAYIEASEFSAKCYSMVEIPGCKPFPEIDEFKWVTFSQAKEMLHDTQVKALNDLEESLEPKMVGYKDELEIERRWVLKNKLPEYRKHNYSEWHVIYQFYTKSNGRFRRSDIYDKNDKFVCTKYHHTIKKDVSPGINREYEKEITHAVYSDNLEHMTKYISKHRYIFYNSQNLKFELDFFEDANIMIMEVELKALDAELIIPGIFNNNIIAEVTGDKKWSNFNLATEYLPNTQTLKLDA